MSTSLNFDKLKQIDPRTKIIVAGYIRKQQTLLLSMNDNNAFYNIPQLISYHILLYFNQSEYWQIVGKWISVSEDKKSIIQLTNLPNTNFGWHTILSTEKCICKWDIFVDKKTINMTVGVSTNHTKRNEFISDISTSYYYSAHSGNKGTSTRFEQYAATWHTGDLIRVELDLFSKTVTFYKNGECQGIAHKNIKCGTNIYYKLAVSLDGLQCKATIKNYERI